MTPEQKEIALRIAEEMNWLTGSTGIVEFASRFLAALPKSEPVAFVHLFEKGTALSWYGESSDHTARQDWIGCTPLYTHSPDSAARIAELEAALVVARQAAEHNYQANAKNLDAWRKLFKPDFKASTEEEGDAFAHGYFEGVDDCVKKITELENEVAILRSNQDNLEATHRLTLKEVQAEPMRLQTANDELREKLRVARESISEALPFIDNNYAYNTLAETLAQIGGE